MASAPRAAASGGAAPLRGAPTDSGTDVGLAIAVLCEQLVDATVERVLAVLRAQQQQHQQQDWLTTVEAAKYLRCQPQRLYNLIQQDAVPVHREGGRLLFSRAELDQWVRAR